MALSAVPTMSFPALFPGAGSAQTRRRVPPRWLLCPFIRKRPSACRCFPKRRQFVGRGRPPRRRALGAGQSDVASGLKSCFTPRPEHGAALLRPPRPAAETTWRPPAHPPAVPAPHRGACWPARAPRVVTGVCGYGTHSRIRRTPSPRPAFPYCLYDKDFETAISTRTAPSV